MAIVKVGKKLFTMILLASFSGFHYEVPKFQHISGVFSHLTTKVCVLKINSHTEYGVLDITLNQYHNSSLTSLPLPFCFLGGLRIWLIKQYFGKCFYSLLPLSLPSNFPPPLQMHNYASLWIQPDFFCWI